MRGFKNFIRALNVAGAVVSFFNIGLQLTAKAMGQQVDGFWLIVWVLLAVLNTYYALDKGGL